MLLSGLVALPIVGAIAVSLLPGSAARSARTGAIVTWLGLVAVTLAVVLAFQPENSHSQLSELVPWLPTLGLDYRLAIDGWSLPLVVLNTLLVGVAIFSTSEDVQRPKFYYALIFLLTSGVYGAFVAHDLLLFFLFYELELIPLYFLIAIWGGERRNYAATKFLIYTALSGMLILAAFLGLAGAAGFESFAYDRLQAFVATHAGTEVLPTSTQAVLLIFILLGFGIKIPLVPLHTWLPDAHVEASTPISILLAGVLLKVGTYGLLRFGLGLFPDQWAAFAPGLAVWATLSVLYGALAAIAQGLLNGDMKKMVAYSSVGHMGFILLAGAAATPVSLNGAALQMVSHGLISALLFLLVGLIYRKTGTRKLEALGGLFNPERGSPVVGSLMVLGVMASSGIPGMAGFIAEFTIFRGSFPVFPIPTLLCMIGTGLTAVYFLLLLDQVFFGRLPDRLENLPPVSWRDRAPALVLALPIALFGIEPGWLARWSEAATTALAASLSMLTP